MKLFKALVGLAAAASVIPLKVEKVEDGGKKTVRISSLTWKAEYTSASEEDDATLNINLMGGLKELVKKKEKPEEETEEIVDAEGSEEEIVTPEFDLADRISDGGIRWVDLENAEETEKTEEISAEEEIPTQDVKAIAQRLSGILKDMDDLFVDAIEAVVDLGKASTSMLQRKLQIGYGRATKIIDAMTKCEIVSLPNGSKPRDVLINADQWEEIKGQMNEEITAPEAEETTETE